MATSSPAVDENGQPYTHSTFPPGHSQIYPVVREALEFAVQQLGGSTTTDYADQVLDDTTARAMRLVREVYQTHGS